ncbi:MAG: alpha/beta hydrolase [Thiohalospira sp.]
MTIHWKRFLKIAGILLSIFLIISVFVNFYIAKSVISSLTDVRIEKNDHTLDDFGLKGEQIFVQSEDGLQINAYIIPNEQSKGNVIILHGMHGMDATSLFDYAKFVFDSGFTPVCVDMRAHGKSDGESLSLAYNETKDVKAAIKYLKDDKNFNKKPIIIYGLSMGASTAINTASKYNNVDGIIAVSPFLSIQDQISDYMQNDGAPELLIKILNPFYNLILRNKFKINPKKESPKNLIQNIQNIPVLIIHGEMDSQTKVYQAKELYRRCSSNKKELWIVNDKGHLIVDDVLKEDAKFYRDKIITFLTNNFE